MTVNINKQKEIPLETEQLKNKLKEVLTALNLKDADVGVTFVSDEQMRALNKRYRNKDATTNVLSFCMQEGEARELAPNLLGDIVISVDMAQREAQECGFSLEEIVDFYLIHGLLHLIGCHHDHPDHESMMRKLWLILKHKPYWEE